MARGCVGKSKMGAADGHRAFTAEPVYYDEDSIGAG
jgi:hypothetical protein